MPMKEMSDVVQRDIVSGAEKERAARHRTEAMVLRPAWIAGVLLGITALLVLMHVGANLAALRWDNTVTRVLLLEFGVDAENNVPTFFSTALLLFSALLLAVVAGRRRDTAHARRWALLAFIFLFLALDEAAGAHEYFNEPFRGLLGASGMLYYAWVIPGALFTLAFCLYYLRFLWDLPARTRRLFILAGVLFVGGAMGVELLGAQYYSLYGVKDLAYSLVTAVEETCEMCGVIVFIYALLDYLGRLPGPVHVRVESREIHSNADTRP